MTMDTDDDVSKDMRRALTAAKSIIDGRDIETDMPTIMVTLESAVAVVLVALFRGDQRLAAAMLNEGLLQGVEERLGMVAALKGKGDKP